MTDQERGQARGLQTIIQPRIGMKGMKDQDQDQIEMRIKREVRGVTNLGIEITKGQMSSTMEVPRIGRNLEIPDTEMTREEMSQEVRDLEEMCQEVQEPEDRQIRA